MANKQYWISTHTIEAWSASREFRAMMAWELIEKWGLVAGRLNEIEDGAGRAVIRELTPEETVSRAFAIVDIYMATVEARGEIRDFTDADAEAACSRAGTLERIKGEAHYPPRIKEAV